jgi:hypothetical protein
MRLDVYGRFVLDVVRDGDRWVAFYVGEGKRRRAPDVVLPPDATEGEVLDYLEVLFHEAARPGHLIRRLDR